MTDTETTATTKKTHRGKRSKPKRAARAARNARVEAATSDAKPLTQGEADRQARDDIEAAKRGRPENAPLREGYRRFTVDLRIKDADYIVSAIPLYEAEMRRKMTAGEVIDLIVRRVIMIDPRRYVGQATQPVV